MERTIENPYSTNKRLYICIIGISLTILIVSFIIGFAVLSEGDIILETVLEIVKNLSYGCIASAVVAWIIDCADTKNENRKANQIYDAVYMDLKFQLKEYICVWASICAVAYKDEDYNGKRNTWFGWYECTRDKFIASTPERQEALICFFKDQLQCSIEKVNGAIDFLTTQYNTLIINGVINDDLWKIIEDYRFEFHAADMDLILKDGYSSFWAWMDAINKDIEQYISNWKDIKYYNFVRFRPRKFYEDRKEVCRAILEAKGYETTSKHA